MLRTCSHHSLDPLSAFLALPSSVALNLPVYLLFFGYLFYVFSDFPETKLSEGGTRSVLFAPISWCLEQ